MVLTTYSSGSFESLFSCLLQFSPAKAGKLLIKASELILIDTVTSFSGNNYAEQNLENYTFEGTSRVAEGKLTWVGAGN